MLIQQKQQQKKKIYEKVQEQETKKLMKLNQVGKNNKINKIKIN